MNEWNKKYKDNTIDSDNIEEAFNNKTKPEVVAEE
jgi:hypothetical protein